jgi:hypothetical protein
VYSLIYCLCFFLLVGIVSFELSAIDSSLRGFSDTVRSGRYAYFAPLSSGTKTYASKLIRLDLGLVNIGETIRSIQSRNAAIKGICDILDLSQADPNHAGYGGIFTHGKFLVLSPYRNQFEPKNGQRGHGYITRGLQFKIMTYDK